MDSISTSARIRANWIPGRAPGFRARPSQAAAVALDCAKPHTAEAMAMANPEVIQIHLFVSEPPPPAGVCAKAGAAKNRPTTAPANHRILRFIPFLLEVPPALSGRGETVWNFRQEVVSRHPSCSRDSH